MKTLSKLGLAFALLSTPAFADVCTVPGDEMLTDPAGDAVGIPNDPFDLLSLSVAAPAAASIDDQTVVFTIGTGGEPVTFGTPGSGVFISFEDPRRIVRGVRADQNSGGGIDFLSYVVAVDNDGEYNGQFIESSMPAEGSYAGGILTITVKAKDIGVRALGDTIGNFNGGGIFFAGAQGAGGSLNLDSMPDSGRAGGPVTIGGCKKAAARAAELPQTDVVAFNSKAGTNFGGAFGLLNLLILLPLALRRRG